VAGSPPLRSSSFRRISSSQSRQQRLAIRSRRVTAAATAGAAKSTVPKPGDPGNRVGRSERSANLLKRSLLSREADECTSANKPKTTKALSFPLFRPFKVWRTSRGSGCEQPGVACGGRRRIRRRSLEHGLQAMHGDVAQLGEHLLCKQGVGGSSPLISTMHVDNRIGL
jgi:hypothetical protein